MKQRYAVIVLFALIIASSLTSLGSYSATERLVSEDMDRALALAGIDALEAYLKSTGIPMTLMELDIGPEHFEAMAAQATEGGRLEQAFVPLTAEDVIRIYEACL